MLPNHIFIILSKIDFIIDDLKHDSFGHQPITYVFLMGTFRIYSFTFNTISCSIIMTIRINVLFITEFISALQNLIHNICMFFLKSITFHCSLKINIRIFYTILVIVFLSFIVFFFKWQCKETLLASHYGIKVLFHCHLTIFICFDNIVDPYMNILSAFTVKLNGLEWVTFTTFPHFKKRFAYINELDFGVIIHISSLFDCAYVGFTVGNHLQAFLKCNVKHIQFNKSSDDATKQRSLFYVFLKMQVI